MNYYDEIFREIEDLIKNEKYAQAQGIVENELSIAYIPRDIENKLKEYQSVLKEKTYIPKSISDSDIESYLKGDKQKQLIAVEQLNSKNLRNYLDLCKEYLAGDGFENAKVLLIDSLVKQEINDQFVIYRNKEKITFNTSLIKPIEINPEFEFGLKLLRDHFMKEPSKTILAEQLLYKQFMMNYPLSFDTEEVKETVEGIIEYINEAFR